LTYNFNEMVIIIIIIILLLLLWKQSDVPKPQAYLESECTNVSNRAKYFYNYPRYFDLQAVPKPMYTNLLS